MRFTMSLKALVVLGLSLLFLIPLAMTQNLVESRNQRQMETEAQVAQLTAQPQTLIGPLLVVPYTVEVKRLDRHAVTGEWHEAWEQRRGEHVIHPRSTQYRGTVRIEARRRGLYRTQVFRFMGSAEGAFQVPDPLEPVVGRNLRLKQPRLVLGLSDPRGILNAASLNLGSKTFPFQPGTSTTRPPQGIHALLPSLENLQGQELTYQIPLELMGTHSLRFAPVADETTVDLEGGWHAPSFEGGFAPVERTWSKDGFSARWKIPALSRDLSALLESDEEGARQHFGVAFLDPVNIYLQSERATKYGFLFVFLTFGAFLLRERLKGQSIHPVQYVLVGASLALFFLLVLSLAEHLGFAWAYVLAVVPNLALLGTYLTGALRSVREGIGFTFGLGVLYAALYGLLASEDNALLLGSMLLFALLAGIMLGTRSMDWQRPTRSQEPPPLPMDESR